MRLSLLAAAVLLVGAILARGAVAAGGGRPNVLWMDGVGSGRHEGLDYSGDGQILASAWDNTVAIYRAADGRMLHTLSVPAGVTAGPSLSADGSRICYEAGSPPNLQAEIRQTSDGQLLQTIPIPVTSYSGIFALLSPDGQYVAIDAFGLYRVSDGSLVFRMPRIDNWLGKSAFSRDGQTLAARVDSGWQFLSVPSGASAGPILNAGYAGAFAPGSPRFATFTDEYPASPRKYLGIYDLPSYNRAYHFPLHDNSAVPGSVAFNSDGTRVSCAGFAIGAAGQYGFIEVWDLSSQQRIALIKKATNSNGGIDATAVSPDGQRGTIALKLGGNLVGFHPNYDVLQYDLSDGSISPSPIGHAGFCHGLAVSPDGTLVATVGDDSRLLIRRVSDGQLVRRADVGAVLNSVSFSPDGRLLVTGGPAVQIWDVSTGSLIRTLVDASIGGSFATFSPDGQSVAVCAGSSLVTTSIYRVSDGALLTSDHPSSELVVATAQPVYSRRGTYLAFTSYWQGGGILVTRPSDLTQLFRETSQTDAAAFSPDEQLLAYGYGNTIRIRRTSDWSLVRTLTGHFGRLETLAFSPDGATLLSAAWDSTLRIWSVAGGSLLQTYDQEVGTPVSAATDRTYGITALAYSPDSREIYYARTDSVTVAASNPIVGDAIPPSCSRAVVGTDGAGRVTAQVTVQDTGSGLASIQVVSANNCTVSWPPFPPGSTAPVTVTATKINQSLRSSFSFRASDVAGNVAACDPVLARLVVPRGGQEVTRIFRHVPGGEHCLSVTNGSSGLTRLTVSVNGKLLPEISLTEGGQASMDLGTAMHGGDNRVTIAGYGSSGGSATILIADQTGSVPAPALCRASAEWGD